MESQVLRGNVLAEGLNPRIHEVLQRQFKGTYEWGGDRELRFLFSDGVPERYQSGIHQVSMSSGFWSSSLEGFPGNELYVCSSAMEAVSFALFQSEKLGNLNQSCWISFGLKCQFPGCIPDVLKGKKVNLLFGRDLLDVLRAVKICVSLKCFSVDFWLRQNYLDCFFRGRNYSFPVEGFSLSRFKQATGFRDYSRMKRPQTAESYFQQLLFNS